MALLFSLEWKKWNQLFDYDANGWGKTLNYDALRQMGEISLQQDLKSETCLVISDLRFKWVASLSEWVVGSVQLNILKGCIVKKFQ